MIRDESHHNKRIIEFLAEMKAMGHIIEPICFNSAGHLEAGMMIDQYLVAVHIVEVAKTLTVNEYATKHSIHRNTVLHRIKKGKLWAFKGKSGGKSAWRIPPVQDKEE